MNAALKIDARAVERPTYDNTNVAKGAVWMSDNWLRLREYWTSLGGQGQDGRFFQFATVQWDRERMAL